MAGQYGVKETKEAVLALTVLGAFVASRLKDGVGVDDAMALGQKLMMDAEFKTKLADGVTGLEIIPKEMGELDMADGFELAKVLPEVIAEVQKVA